MTNREGRQHFAFKDALGTTGYNSRIAYVIRIMYDDLKVKKNVKVLEQAYVINKLFHV